MINDISYFAAFLIGLVGSIHCFGMCGGIVSAFSLSLPANTSLMPYLLSYNLGRIFSYSIAGAITGYFGYLFKIQFSYAPLLLKLFSGVFLLLLAAYIGGWWRGLLVLEQKGQHIWRFLSPISKRFLPIRSPFQAIPYGAIWGWLPCGLVYSTLSWSLGSGSGVQGALIMLCFGLGTLPSMISTGLSAEYIKKAASSPVLKHLIAGILFTFGTFYIVAAVVNFH